MIFRGASGLVAAVLTFLDGTFGAAAFFLVSFGEGEGR
jgi:hypothetical protein